MKTVSRTVGEEFGWTEETIIRYEEGRDSQQRVFVL